MTIAPNNSNLLLRPQLLANGCSDEVIKAAQRRAEWQQVRPGAYLKTEDWDPLEQDERHRVLIAATVPKLGTDTVVSHTSAARLHGLPVWVPAATSEVVHVTRNRSSGGYRKGRIHAHVGVLEPGMTTDLNGMAVTSVARTVIDCACTVSFAQGVAMADYAVHSNLTSLTDLADTVDGLGRRQGGSRARQVVISADGRSESPGESFSRLTICQCGLPTPELQFEIRDGLQLIARSDFAWQQFRTVGEFDGRVKYGRLLKPGQTAGDVLWEEKRREDAIRSLGWEVVRWTWADLANPAALAEMLRRAFERGSRFL